MRLLLHKGDTRTYRLEFKDKNNNALDLTNLTVKFIVKDNYSTDDSQAIIDQTATIVDATNGIAEVTLTSTNTNLNYGAYYFEFRLFDSSNQKVTLASGNLIISSSVSDNINNISFVFKENIINLTFQEIIELTSGSGGGGGTSINDTVVSTTTTWSSQKINNELSTKANASHTHSTSDIIDFNSSVDNKISAHNTDNTSHTDIRNELANKLTKFTTFTADDIVIIANDGTIRDSGKKLSDLAPATHTHTINDITNLQSALDSKANKLTTFTVDNILVVNSNGDIKDSNKSFSDLAPANHNHSLASLSDVDTTGLQSGQVLKWDSTVNKWIPADDLTGSGGGAVIDDNTISATTTWSSQKISSEDNKKIDKPTTFTVNDIAIFDSNGNVIDSGKKTTDFAPATHTHTTSDISDYNTTTDNKINNAISTHNTDSNAHTDIRNAIASKPDIDDTTPSTSTVYSSQKVEDRLSTKADTTHTHSLNDLSDVNTSGATNGQALTYDSGSGLWIPATISGGGGSGGLWQHLQTITLTTTATEIHISGLNNDLIRLVLMLDNTSGVHTYLNMHFSSDNGTTWYVPAANDWFGILSTTTNAFSTFNKNFAYHKNNSWLAGDINIQRFSNGNIYANAPTRSTSNNKWRHSQLIKGNALPNKITDIKIVCADTTAYLNTGSIVEVYGG